MLITSSWFTYRQLVVNIKMLYVTKINKIYRLPEFHFRAQCLPPILAHLVLPATDLYPVGHAHCSSTHTAPPSQ